jgi:hypothetical protein
MNLILSLYNLSDQYRKNEIEKALELNLKNKYLRRIIILNEGFESNLLKHTKIELHQVNSRPTYNDLLGFCKKNDVNIISNNDIVFDETIEKARLYISKFNNVAFALTRIEKNGVLFREQFGDSQDSWIIWSNDRLQNINSFNYYLGVPGCDNRFAYDLEYIIGLNLFNPSKTIKTFHLHSSMKRNYSKSDQLKGDYLLLKPISLLLFRIYMAVPFFSFCTKWKLKKI